MSLISKNLVINKFKLPKEVIDIIKEYIFHTIDKIPKNDKRYEILQSIPSKEYDASDGVTYVYMYINGDKDYFLTYNNFAIQLQTLQYIGNTIHMVEGSCFVIE